MVGRGYCRYLGIDFEHVPKGKRRQALAHQLVAYSMWEDTDYCVAWQGGFAQLWFWDADRIAALLRGQKALGFDRVRKPLLLAEAVYWQKPASSGLQLFKCGSGYDLQNWQQSRLIASQWFEMLPDSRQIQRFARSQGLEASALQVIEPMRQESPWSGVIQPVQSYWQDHKKQLSMGGLACSMLLLSLQLITIAQWAVVESGIRSEIAALESSANDLLAARSQARRAQLELANLSQLFTMPDPLASQQAVQQRIPEELSLTLKKWQRNVDRVDLMVEGEIIDSLGLVQALNQKGVSNVKVEPTRISGEYKIQLTIDPSIAVGQAPREGGERG